MLSAHGDQLVRTQARAAYLTILRGLLDEEVREKAIQLAQEMLLFTVWLYPCQFPLNNQVTLVQFFCSFLGSTNASKKGTNGQVLIL